MQINSPVVVVQDPEKDWILTSPPPSDKNYVWQPPEVLLLTPIPGFKFVDRGEYERIMGANVRKSAMVDTE